MRAILISIKPEWVAKILNGEKTIEIRKTMPKCVLPCRVYIYCSKDKKKPLLGNAYASGSWKLWNAYKLIKDNVPVKGWDARTGYTYDCSLANGKVIAEFTLNKIDDFKVFENSSVQYWNWYNLEKSCLTYDEISNYIGKDKIGYAWHIDDLKIYDKPKELNKFYNYDKVYNNSFGWAFTEQEKRKYLKRPPQSWCYVEAVSE